MYTGFSNPTWKAGNAKNYDTARQRPLLGRVGVFVYLVPNHPTIDLRILI